MLNSPVQQGIARLCACPAWRSLHVSKCHSKYILFTRGLRGRVWTEKREDPITSFFLYAFYKQDSLPTPIMYKNGRSHMAGAGG